LVVNQGRPGQTRPKDEALEILKVWSAKGRIDKEEFEQKTTDLLS
jgi:uncharacterized membrane protein